MLKVCDEQLLQSPEQLLLEKENSGCEALLRDNKTDDLSRMFRLFSRIPTGLPPIGNIVRKHITDVGLSLVKAQGSNIDGDLMPYVQELLDIHDKYTELVGTGPDRGCFQGHSIFHKAMKEAFEVFVNKVRPVLSVGMCNSRSLVAKLSRVAFRRISGRPRQRSSSLTFAIICLRSQESDSQTTPSRRN